MNFWKVKYKNKENMKNAEALIFIREVLCWYDCYFCYLYLFRLRKKKSLFVFLNCIMNWKC